MKLINQPFDRDKRKLEKIIDSVKTSFDFINPNEIIYCLNLLKQKTPERLEANT